MHSAHAFKVPCWIIWIIKVLVNTTIIPALDPTGFFRRAWVSFRIQPVPDLALVEELVYIRLSPWDNNLARFGASWRRDDLGVKFVLRFGTVWFRRYHTVVCHLLQQIRHVLLVTRDMWCSNRTIVAHLLPLIHRPLTFFRIIQYPRI